MADREMPPNNSDKVKNAREEASKYRSPILAKKTEESESNDIPQQDIQRGKLKVRKKNPIERFIANFVEEDAKTIKEFIIFDIVIPKIKDLIYDVGSGILGRSLYGGGRPPSSVNRYGTGSYTDYRGRSNVTSQLASRYSYGSNIKTKLENQRRLSSKTTLDDLIFATREEAEDALSKLLAEYYAYDGQASVSDLYDQLARDYPEDFTYVSDYTDQYYGWTQGVNGLETSYTDRVYDGWKLFLPKIMPIK